LHGNGTEFKPKSRIVSSAVHLISGSRLPQHYPERHLQAVKFMGLDTSTAKADDSGEILYEELARLAKVLLGAMLLREL
jgi:hypothetical protein